MKRKWPSSQRRKVVCLIKNFFSLLQMSSKFCRWKKVVKIEIQVSVGYITGVAFIFHSQQKEKNKTFLVISFWRVWSERLTYIFPQETKKGGIMVGAIVPHWWWDDRYDENQYHINLGSQWWIYNPTRQVFKKFSKD